jgi:hypothetical protein
MKILKFQKIINGILDIEKMKEIEDVEIDMRNKKKEIEKLFGGLEDTTDICSKTNIEIKNNLASIQVTESDTKMDDYDMGF